jgi:hypothetical protein
MTDERIPVYHVITDQGEHTDAQGRAVHPADAYYFPTVESAEWVRAKTNGRIVPVIRVS